MEHHLVDTTSHLEGNRYRGTIRKDNHFTSVADSYVLSARQNSLSSPSIHHHGNGVVHYYYRLATSSRHIYRNIILSHLRFLGVCFRGRSPRRWSRKSHLKHPQRLRISSPSISESNTSISILETQNRRVRHRLTSFLRRSLTCRPSSTPTSQGTPTK